MLYAIFSVTYLIIQVDGRGERGFYSSSYHEISARFSYFYSLAWFVSFV